MPYMSGAQATVEALKLNGVQLVIGMTGHTIMEVADVLAADGSIRTVYPRSETSGTYMAYGYNRVAGAPRAVCLWHVAGVLHAAPGVITAYADSIPLVVIGGNVTAEAMRRGGFQATPAAEVYGPITKWRCRVQRADELAETLTRAFATAGSGRPGPVFIDVPFDKFVEKIEASIPQKPCTAAPPAGDPEAVRTACEMLLAARKPVLLAGGGVVTAGAAEELQRLAELLCSPVCSGRGSSKGVVPDDHPLALGTSGSFGWKIANEFLQEADCWCAIGCTFSQIAMQDWSVKPPQKLIHIDIDPQEIGRIYQPALGIVGDAKRVLAQMLDCLKDTKPRDYREHPNYREISERKKEWLAELDARAASDSRPISPYRVMREIGAVLPHDGIVTGGAGNNGEFAVHAVKRFKPRTYLASQKYSAVGCSFPIALGAKLAAPGSPVVCVEGDGGFQYNLTELATAVRENIPVVVVVMDDGHLNANRQIARFLFENRQVWTRLNNPDWVTLARSFGAGAERVEDPNEIRPALERGLSSGVPYVIDMVVDPDVEGPVTGRLWKIRW